MQILLNLLPEEKRIQLSRRFRSRFFLWQSVLVLLLAVFYLTMLGGIYYLLNQEALLSEQINSRQGEHDAEAQKLSLYQNKFKETNETIAVVDRLMKNHLRWTNLFILLDQLTGSGIVIVGIVTRDYTVTLNGQARTREDFIDFEDRLKGSECISDVKVPISNLFAQKEIEFQVDFNLKRECLTRAPF